ncbi:MAG: heme lyase CcmF/NrfE family subunit, partial [Calditrichota bacterium]
MYRFGYHLLQLTLTVSIFTVIVSVFGFRKSREDFLASSRRGVILTFGLLSFTAAILVYALLSHDFRVEYVASYTSSTLSPFYSLSAFWAGQKGSLLFWAWILSGFSALVLYQNREKNQYLMPYVIATLMTIEAFFLLLMLFAENPFETLAFTPADGNGLNPLLQNPGMVMHPPTLYLGYIGFSIPFAFAVAALLTRRLDSQWITTTRKWTIVAWFFLTLGNLFGMKWAYVELGWGGFWAWDPVENASFLPWLTGTAFLHSVMIQERRGMLKVWNVSLVVITFLLTILGTFLTRSGIISSVHSFGKSAVGPFFLWGILAATGFALWLILTRLPDLKSEHQLDSLLSRESSFLLNNLLLLGAAFAVLWGTLFPMISEAVTGAKVTVGAPFFNQVGTPIFLALLLLTGICPLIAWRKATGKNFRRNFLWPMTFSLAGGVLFLILGLRNIYIWMSFVFALFVVYSVGMEFWKGVHTRIRTGRRTLLQALGSLFRTNQRRYGGYVVHLGLIMVFVGITGSVGFKTEQKIQLEQGQSKTVKNY